MRTTAALAPRSGPTGTGGRGRRDPFLPVGNGPRVPGGAQSRRGSARVPRGPAIPAARARRPRRRALSGAYHDIKDGRLGERLDEAAVRVVPKPAERLSPLEPRDLVHLVVVLPGLLEGPH